MMKSLKLFSIGLLAIGAFLLSSVPAKAQYSYDNNSYMNYSRDYSNYDYNRYGSYNNYGGYNNYYDGSYSRGVVYPRTVYLIDAGNSANQLNIINARRNGSVTAAWITVRSRVYDRIVNDYNQLGVVSVSVDRRNNVATFRTVNGMITTAPVDISFGTY